MLTFQNDLQITYLIKIEVKTETKNRSKKRNLKKEVKHVNLTNRVEKNINKSTWSGTDDSF